MIAICLSKGITYLLGEARALSALQDRFPTEPFRERALIGTLYRASNIQSITPL